MFSDILDAVRFYSARELFGWVKMLVKSVLGMKREYTLSFEQDPDSRWYVVFPNWPLERGHLEMVAGADDMLNLLDKAQTHRVTVSVIPARKQQQREDYIQLTCVKSSLGGGGFYTVQGLEGWGNPHAKREKQLWLCPVTLCVLGRYPKFIYVKTV